jgi:hypothetical protein
VQEKDHHDGGQGFRMLKAGNLWVNRLDNLCRVHGGD